MPIIPLLRRYLIESQLFVSLMGTLLAVFFMLEQNAFRFPTVILIFITFLSGYLYTKYQGNKKKMKTVLLFNTLAFVICAVLILKNHNEIRLLKWLVIVVLGLLYNSNFLSKTVRSLPLVKIFYVGLVWALICGWLFLEELHWGIFLFTWLFISSLVIPFDIRDLRLDRVLTLPGLIGIEKSKYVSYFLFFLSLPVAYFYFSGPYFYSLTLALLLGAVAVYFSSEKRKEPYYSFWVELTSGVPFLFLAILDYF